MSKLISTDALIARINRVLRRNDEVLRKSRSMRMWLDCGNYYIVDVSMNAVVCQRIDPESLGRELGVLKPWEEAA